MVGRLAHSALLGLMALLASACVQPSRTAAPTGVPPATYAAPTDAATAAPAAPTPAVWTPPPRTKTSGCTSQGGLPDPACTPGALNPGVSQANIANTICDPGWTSGRSGTPVRPPVSVTDRIKREQMAAYGLQGKPLGDYELDHLVSLELGGAPQDVANLWPQPWNGDTNAHMKDAVETYLKREVCRGSVALADAQRQIATNWLGVYRQRNLTPSQEQSQ